MKNTLFTCIAIILIVSLATACGGTPKNDGRSSSAAESSSKPESIYNPESTGSTEPKITADFLAEVDGFTLDLSPEDLLLKLKEKQYELIIPDYSETPEHISRPVKDGREYNGTSTNYDYHTVNGMCFTYNSEGDMQSIGIKTHDIPTAEGLKVGDNLETMKRIYGGNYKPNVESYTVRQYCNGKEYLNIYYADNTIWSWEINRWWGINAD